MFEVELRRKDFLNQYPLLNMMNINYVADMKKPQPTHLYVHIPFCYKKCAFCYYKSENLVSKEIPKEYFDALIKEIDLYAQKNIILRSMYWGGGTPTTMSEQQIEFLLNHIYSKFQITEDFEFCCEVRPGPELTDAKIEALQKNRIKRISMGLQSLNPQILKYNGRNHSVEMFYQTYKKIKDAGIYSVNVDLMSGLVGDTLSSFMESLKKLVSLLPENITIYKLQLYYNSELYRKIRQEKVDIITDEEEFHMISEAYDYLTSMGYKPADNFSFKKSDEYSHLHRVATWNGEDMIGIGASAHSCANRTIYQNEIDINKYIEIVQEEKSPIKRGYSFSIYEDMVRHFIFGIKSCFYPLENFRKRFGIDIMHIFNDEIQWLVEHEYAQIDLQRNVLTTTKIGTLYADDIIRAFFPDKQKEINMGFQNRHLKNNNM